MRTHKNTPSEVSGGFGEDSPNRFYRLKEVAKIINVDITTLHSWIRKGKLVPRRTIGGSPYLIMEDIEKLAHAQERSYGNQKESR